jgi:AP-3 complex subunit beta
LHEFAAIPTLAPGASVVGTLGVDFNDSTHPINFEIIIGPEKSCQVSLKASIGELIRAVAMPEEVFVKQQSKMLLANM